MNKVLISLALVLAGISPLTHAAPAKPAVTKDSLFMAITSTHTLVFGKDNLLLERMKPEDSNKWFDLIKEIRTFVKEQVPSSSLNKKVDDLWQASADLTNSLKEFYATTFSKKPFALNDANRGRVEKRLADLRDIQKKIKEIFKDSEKAPLFEKSNHKNAREVVNRLALFLDTTYEKVFIDWKKILVVYGK